MIKILFSLIAIILFISCGQYQPQFRVDNNVKNQKEINFIKNNCSKYSGKKLSSCIQKSKESFKCLQNTEEYLKKMHLQSKIECRKESNRQFPYLQNYQAKEDKNYQLQEEDFDIIQDNIDYFLAADKISFYKYDDKKKKYITEEKGKIKDNYQGRFTTHYSRNEFIKKCQKNFDDRGDLFKETYIKKCYKILSYN